jgi:MazG family protein
MHRKSEAFERLEEVVERLRGPGGCPWDREQTLADMGRYLQEEASEVQDALDEADGRPTGEVCEELGDLLMNILLAARIAEEAGAFSFIDVADGIRAKLIRRHPHVFGDAVASSVADVLKRWNEIKAAESEGTAGSRSLSRLEKVPRSLPPLARAHKLSALAAEFGFDWPDASGALEKLEEEVREVRELVARRGVASEGDTGGAVDPDTPASPPHRSAHRDEDLAQLEEELGDVLFATVSLVRKLGIDPDQALRSTLRKFVRRFRYLEENIQDFESATLADMDRVWDELRRRERLERGVGP